MSNILQRISQIAEIEELTISKIEQKIGASKGVLYKAIQKNTDIQSKWLVLIVENFPQFNPDWLLTGKGEMLRNSNRNLQPVATNEQMINDDSKSLLLEMSEKIDFLYKVTMAEVANKELIGLKEVIENAKQKKDK